MEPTVSQDCALPFGGAQIEFPQTFDLRVIYVLASGAMMRSDLTAIYAAQGVPCSRFEDIATSGTKYGRLLSRLTFADGNQMRAVYEAIGRLAYVKGVF